MKNATLTLYFLTILLIIPSIINAQNTFTGQRVELTGNRAINNKFTDPDVYNIDISKINAALDSPAEDGRINLKFGAEYKWNLELYPVEMRSPNYKVRVLTENGIEERRSAKIQTYYGYLAGRPGSEVRVTIKDGFLYGYVQDGESTVYFEPASRFHKSLNGGEVILYRPDQVIQKTMTCAHSEKVKNQKASTAINRSSDGAGQCWELDLAIASDYSYFLERGSIEEVTAYTLGVMNNVATNYQLNGDTNFEDGIEFLIVENFIVATQNGDPWTPSTDADALLPDFAAWARNSGGFSATHDLGQLWTSRDFDGSTIGLAYRSTDAICNPFRYHILEDYSDNAAALRVLTAHEIGHNFGASHDMTTGFIMSKVLNITNTWSQNSKNLANTAIINASVESDDCLVACTSGPPVSNFTAGTTSGCSGTAITFFNNSANGSNCWNWSFPGGNPSSSNLQNPTVVYSSDGSYDVSLTAGNGAGDGNTETKSDFITILKEPAAVCTPGGNIGNGGISLFALANIRNSSGNATQDGFIYQDNSCSQVANLEPGTTYAGTFNVGNPSLELNEAIRVYIDYNNDGDFVDDNELAFADNFIYRGGPFDFNITTPAAPAVKGTILRMRVIANESINNPCQNMTTGQVEDYGIIFPGAAPLPVTLISYEAAARNQTTLLNWITESEFNNDYYTLEYGTDGRNYAVLDEINGQGSTTEIFKYQYLHKTPIIGDNYYRLTQTDFDGTQEVLGTRVVTFKTDEVVVEIQPNPIHNETLRTAYISPEDGMVEMTVLGVDGKIVRYLEQAVTTGTNMINLDLPDLSNGIYFLRTVQGTVVKTTRFVKSN